MRFACLPVISCVLVVTMSGCQACVEDKSTPSGAAPANSGPGIKQQRLARPDRLREIRAIGAEDSGSGAAVADGAP